MVLEFFFGEYLYNITHDDIIKSQEFTYEKLNLKVFDNSEDSPGKNNEDSIASDIFITEFFSCN